MAKEQITDDVVDNRRLPGWENYSVNQWIGMYLGQLNMEGTPRALHTLLSEYGYTGNSPKILFGIYDFLAQDSEEALVHGIRAYELSGHDIEQVAKLKNPGRLVSYIIDVTDETETLVSLQEKMFHASKTHTQYSGFGSTGAQYRSAEKTNAASFIVELGLAVNERLAHINLLDTEQRESLGFQKWGELMLQRRQALEMAVLVQQDLTGDSEETMSILAIYDSLTGSAGIRGLDYDVLDKFMRIKLGLDKPSQDEEIPEDLKADAYYEDRLAVFGTIDLEQLWRLRHFGSQKKAWERDREYREKSEERRKRDQAKLGEEDYRRMLEDPWAFYSEQLALLGLTKEMSYEDARRSFRRKIREHVSVFNTPFGTGSEYEASQEAAKAIISAWEIASALYRAKEVAETPTDA